MNYIIGIRLEDKNMWERRVPLTPDQVHDLKDKEGIQVQIQPSKIRAFSDLEYKNAGAEVKKDIWTESKAIFAIKEIPVEMIHPNRTYMFFAHVIKGQKDNMPLLQKIIDLKCTLIDYEKVIDEQSRRLIYFGNYAGFAGMIDTLWALGQRLQAERISTPFQEIKPAHEYHNLDEAIEEIRIAGKKFALMDPPMNRYPIVIGFLGYGNVSTGAQKILDCFPIENILPENIKVFYEKGEFDPHKIYKVVFYEKDLVKPKNPSHNFDLHEYYNHPEKYVSQFDQYLPFFMVLINAIYWDKMYPRFVTKAKLKEIFSESFPRLKVIGDISCDVNGAVEATIQTTDSANPVYVYNPDTEHAEIGVKGHGPVVLAVDNLPCQLPKESSAFFGNILKEYVPIITKADYSVSFNELKLTPELKNAVIVYQGKLTPNYNYLEKFLPPK
ncbi:MAG: bifunctional lysine ketoglutarate reductase /saccharopine dehydrogenase family protein [Candidatus Hodarchaeales archaeon]|jgi:alpha-aminoadipic semialdehyde synthase